MQLALEQQKNSEMSELREVLAKRIEAECALVEEKKDDEIDDIRKEMQDRMQKMRREMQAEIDTAKQAGLEEVLESESLNVNVRESTCAGSASRAKPCRGREANREAHKHDDNYDGKHDVPAVGGECGDAVWVHRNRMGPDVSAKDHSLSC